MRGISSAAAFSVEHKADLPKGCLLGRMDDDLYQDVFQPFGVTTSQFHTLMSAGVRFRGPKGTVIVEGGTLCSKFHLVLRGEAIALQGNAEGKPVCRYPGRIRSSAPDASSANDPLDPDNLLPRRGCVIAGSSLVDPSRMSNPYPNHVMSVGEVEWIQWDVADLKQVTERFGWRRMQAAIFNLLYTELVGSLGEERQLRRAKLMKDDEVEAPQTRQLLALSAFVAVPFFGFGFADNFIMIICGDAIDSTLGVRFGLTTLAAAGLGNWISDVVGLGLGDMIERAATRIGLHDGGLTPAQQGMNRAKFVTLFSRMLGISLGCFAGMVPLMFLSAPKVEFTNQDLEVFNAIFGPHGVTTVQFAGLMERGRRRRAAAGDAIMEVDEPQATVKLLLSGHVTALSDGKEDCAYVGRLERPEPEGKRQVPLRGSIIGGAAVADPTLRDKPCGQRCVASSAAEWIEWDIEDLKKLMEEEHSIQASFYSMLYGELLTGLHSEERKNQMERYQAVLTAVIADGVVHETERHLIRDYQKRLDISELEHLTCLQEHGWTLLGWERGSMDSCQASAQQQKARGCRPALLQQTPQGVAESAQELQRASEIIDGVLEGLRRAAQADSASSCAVASTPS